MVYILGHRINHFIAEYEFKQNTHTVWYKSVESPVIPPASKKPPKKTDFLVILKSCAIVLQDF